MEKKDTEGELAGALLYSNIADYLATNLYDSLVLFSENAIKQFSLGSVSYKIKRKSKDLTLGELLNEIDKFDFEDKNEIVSKLKQINSARIPVVHHIAKTPPEKLISIDDKVQEIAKYTEELINLIDELYINKMPPVSILDISVVSSKKPKNL